MDYTQYNLGSLSGSEIVVVTIDRPTNVFLLNSRNYSNYRNGSEFTYYGGKYKESPIKIRVPRPGIWHVIIEHGRRGTIRSSVNVTK